MQRGSPLRLVALLALVALWPVAKDHQQDRTFVSGSPTWIAEFCECQESQVSVEGSRTLLTIRVAKHIAPHSAEQLARESAHRYSRWLADRDARDTQVRVRLRVLGKRVCDAAAEDGVVVYFAWK